jgi:hypothetical protein
MRISTVAALSLPAVLTISLAGAGWSLTEAFAHRKAMIDLQLGTLAHLTQIVSSASALGVVSDEEAAWHSLFLPDAAPGVLAANFQSTLKSRASTHAVEVLQSRERGVFDREGLRLLEVDLIVVGPQSPLVDFLDSLGTMKPLVFVDACEIRLASPAGDTADQEPQLVISLAVSAAVLAGRTPAPVIEPEE